MMRRPPRSTCTDTLLPDTPLCRSVQIQTRQRIALAEQDAVVAAVQRQRTEEEIQHLAERQRDHDDLHTDGTKREIASSDEHTSELKSLMRTANAVFCSKEKSATKLI